jgi:MFS family permease
MAIAFEAAATARSIAEATKAWIVKEVGGPGRLPIILILGAVLGLDAADKGTISAVAGQLEKAFGINNTQMGLLIAVVSFVGALATLPMGVLADRLNRRNWRSSSCCGRLRWPSAAPRPRTSICW